MIGVEGPFLVDPEHVGYAKQRWPTTVDVDGRIRIPVHNGAVSFVLDEKRQALELVPPDAKVEAVLANAGIELWKIGRPGLSSMEGVAIYCRSQTCAQNALKFHRPPPLVARWIPLQGVIDIVVSHPMSQTRKRSSGNDWRADLLPAPLLCHRCGAIGRVTIQLTEPSHQE
jgi:hypothetical protein